MVWSWHSGDPATPDSVMQHEYMGSMSINLLGGLGNPPSQPSDSDSFIIANIDVSCSEYIIIWNIYSTHLYVIANNYYYTIHNYIMEYLQHSFTITGVNVNCISYGIVMYCIIMHVLIPKLLV